MNSEEREELYHRARLLWGFDAQVMMFIEECGEGIVAAAKLGRNTNGMTTEEFVNEVADVMIMAEQMRVMLPEGLVDKYIDKKIERLNERVWQNEQIRTDGEL